MPFNLLYDYYSRARYASGYHAQLGGTFYIKCVILTLVAKPSLGFIRAVSKDMALIFLPKKRTKAQTTLALTKILEMVLCY